MEGRDTPAEAERPRTRGGWAPSVAVLLVLALVVASCAPGPNPEVGVASDGVVAGFWLGLWHGVIAPVTFVISLFTDEVNLYAVNNSGNFYDVGFFLGLTMSLGGGGASGSRGARGAR